MTLFVGSWYTWIPYHVSTAGVPNVDAVTVVLVVSAVSRTLNLNLIVPSVLSQKSEYSRSPAAHFPNSPTVVPSVGRVVIRTQVYQSANTSPTERAALSARLRYSLVADANEAASSGPIWKRHRRPGTMFVFVI